ncbi:MAG TPA: cytochrome c oxidase subunit II [Gaiellaceae bacterium]|nr:cytochrome c oxidase subunit II [Gaiellaceae bacterium]
MRRGSIIQLAAIALVAGAICTAVALAIPWLPVAAGQEAVRTHFTYWFVTIICIGVFSVVAAVLTYTVWKFRAGPDDDSDGPPTHGNTKLEIVWTAIPAVLVTAISVVSAIVLAQNGQAGPNPLIVKVHAQQFAWSFTYPNGQTYGYLTVPTGRHVKLEITTSDVIHSFWVPQLSQKQDAVPGMINSIVITPTRVGTYPVICTELCGLGHALMRSHVDIVSPANYAAWVATGGKAAGPPGLAVFQQNGCGGCHTFTPASSTGTVGPNLDNLAALAKRANRGTLAAFIEESIVKPSAYLEPGYPDAMPHIFGTQIPPGKLKQLVQYLAAGPKQ